MLGSSFFRRLFLPYLLLVCVATATIGFYASLRLRNGFLSLQRDSLQRQAPFAWRLLEPLVRSGRLDSVRGRIAELSASLDSRIELLDADGRVVAQSRPGEDTDDLHRAETADADRWSLAQTFNTEDGKNYVLRLAVPLAPLDHQLHLLYVGMATVTLAAFVVAAALGFHLARRHADPVRELADFANDLSKGNLGRRIMTPAGGDIGALTRSLNTMADSLTGLISQTSHDRAELAAILASMSEGVIATDLRQQILLANSKAGELLGFDARGAVGHPLWEVVRIEPVLKAAAEVQRGGERRAFPVSPSVGRHLEVTVRRFGANGSLSGMVVVAHDTTRSVRYDELRKEFVANVSHELRTPLTVIKGFTETLQDGALSDPIRGPQFLATIVKHLDQLTNLVNDLLELSRLEGTPELPRPANVDVVAVARKAVDLLLPAAQRKHQTLTLEVKGVVPRVLGNPDYLERAVANLIDNAIKYTHDGGTILFTASASDGQIFLEVADNGIGIPADDIPRIFERFYRVDRSRSREMGGTGLGLSIVKHVAQVHGGGIDVASTPGLGSRFRLRLPVPEEI